MNEIPTKVYAALGAEIGLLTGMGIILFYTLRIVHKVTVDKRWNDFFSHR